MAQIGNTFGSVNVFTAEDKIESKDLIIVVASSITLTSCLLVSFALNILNFRFFVYKKIKNSASSKMSAK